MAAAAHVHTVLTRDSATGSFGVSFAHSSSGMCIGSVETNGLAERAGLRPGHLLLELHADGMEYDVPSLSLRALAAILARHLEPSVVAV